MVANDVIVADLQAAIDRAFSPANFARIFSQNPHGTGEYLGEEQGHRFSASIVAATRQDGPGLGILIHQTPSVPQLQQLAGRLYLCFASNKVAFSSHADGLYAYISTPREQAEMDISPRVKLG